MIWLLSTLACTSGCTTSATLDAALPDGGAMDGANRPDAGPAVDAFVDPFDAADACGRAVIEASRLPGSLLFVFDRSGSMNASPTGGPGPPTRWSIAGEAVAAALAAAPDETHVGMLLFPPDGSMCNVVLSASVPQVGIGPLSDTRDAINTEFARIPDGPATPMFDALRAGWAHLSSLGARGERALVLVTDGRENCAPERRDAMIAQAAAELETNGHRTFVIGLTQSNSDLSSLALSGGTRRNADCLAECTTPACTLDSDVPCPDTGAACATFPDGEGGAARAPGFCGCLTSADCPPPMTCDLEGGERVCVGAPNCCHYNASADSFDVDFRAALAEIAARVVRPCIFDLPRGEDPSLFDPAQVNVRVSIDGGEPTTLGRSEDPATSSWDYTSAAQDTITLQGPICDRIQAESATVEIVLGCPTLLI